MDYNSTPINNSPTIHGTAGTDLEDVHFRVAMFDDNGRIIRADGTKNAIGLFIPTNEANPKNGDTVIIQIRYTGLVKTFEVIKPGDALTVSFNGLAMVASAPGNFILGYALTGGAANAVISIDLVKSCLAYNNA